MNELALHVNELELHVILVWRTVNDLEVHVNELELHVKANEGRASDEDRAPLNQRAYALAFSYAEA